jgi:hypothetical protein
VSEPRALPSHVFMASHPCGCVTAFAFDTGEDWVSEDVTRWVREGRHVERVPLQPSGMCFPKCAEHEREHRLKLAAG